MSDKPRTRTQRRIQGTWGLGILLFLLCFVVAFVFATDTLPGFKELMFAMAVSVFVGLLGYFLTGEHKIKKAVVFAVAGVGLFAVVVWWLSPWGPDSALTSITLSRITKPLELPPPEPQSKVESKEESERRAAAESKLMAELEQERQEKRALTREFAALEAGEVRASRMFAGPGQYPPKDFAAYGIVAFTSAPAKYDHDRYVHICAAYGASIPHARSLEKKEVPIEEQMVTVWPVKDEHVADDLNIKVYQEILYTCDRSIDTYDLVASRQAIKEAQRAGVTFSGRGPYLLAWSPGSSKGDDDALVLMSDLSGITKYADILEVFVQWANDIEKNPELWKMGWNVETVRQLIRRWADRWGPAILSLVTGKS